MNITDKATGKKYENLLTPVDNGENGNGWIHIPPMLDQMISGTSAQVRKTENSVNRVVFEVIQKMQLPVEMTRDAKKISRSEKTAEFVLKHTVILEKNARFVKIKTEIENNIKDHRLRMCFPSGVDGDDYFSSQVFCVIKRVRGLNPVYQHYKEAESLDKNTDGIIGVRGENCGLAVVSPYGIREAGVEKNGDMYITLFRSFKSTVQTNGELGGQLLERMRFTYAIVPLDDSVSYGDLQKMKDTLGVKYPMLTCKKQNAEKHEPYFTVSGENVMYSTAEITDFGKCIRVYNMSDVKTTAKITFGFDVKNPKLVDFEGNFVKDVNTDGNEVTFELEKWKIATLLFEV